MYSVILNDVFLLMLIGLFCMITAFKPVEKVRTLNPHIENKERVEEEMSYFHIRVGPLKQPYKNYKKGFYIQLNDQIAELSDLMAFLTKEGCPDCKKYHRVLLDIDKTTPMQLVKAVKQEIRKANNRKIYYLGW